MQYLLMIYRSEAELGKMDAAARQKMTAEYGAFTQSIIQSGNFKAGDGLQPTTTATTVRVRDGKTLTTDGPFAETREQLGGYYLVEAKDLDAALAIAARIPGAKAGSIEVRPIMVYDLTAKPSFRDRLRSPGMTGNATHDPAEIEKIFRDEAGRALATLIRLVGDFDLAEDALQDAFAVALERWPAADPPSNPRAWLVNVGRNKAIDRVRRNIAFRGKQQELTHETAAQRVGAVRGRRRDVLDDDMLRLIFTCCHPSFAAEVQVALTLRTVCGLSTAQVARAFLASEDAMAQRLRARQAEDPARRHSL